MEKRTLDYTVITDGKDSEREKRTILKELAKYGYGNVNLCPGLVSCWKFSGEELGEITIEGIEALSSVIIVIDSGQV